MQTNSVKHKNHKKSDFWIILTVQITLVKHKITKTKWIFSNSNSADQLGQAQKLQKRINSAVTILVLSTLVNHKNHIKRINPAAILTVLTNLVKYKITQKKWFFSNPNSADQLGQAQKLQNRSDYSAILTVLNTVVKYKITQNELILQ